MICIQHTENAQIHADVTASQLHGNGRQMIEVYDNGIVERKIDNDVRSSCHVSVFTGVRACAQSCWLAVSS